jgi:hypothetical protein
MREVFENVNTTAMVLGYPLLAGILILMGWFGTRIFRDLLKIFREMRYDRWKRMKVEHDWDNIEASWLLEYDESDSDSVIEDQYDTFEFPEDFSEQLYNYQEERHERS